MSNNQQYSDSELFQLAQATYNGFKEQVLYENDVMSDYEKCFLPEWDMLSKSEQSCWLTVVHAVFYMQNIIR